MTEKQFIPGGYSTEIKNGNVSAEAPSNIALVKYWGKHGLQLPANPSLSFSLTHCKTKTQLSFEKKNSSENSDGFDFAVQFDGKNNKTFRPKIQQFFERVFPYLPFLTEYRFRIQTENTFPHSSGIASSASGMAALALCLMKIEKKLNPDFSDDFFNQKASFLARLGSGSACRSVYKGLVVWGKHSEIEGSSDLFGIRYPHAVHKNFQNYQDTILLVDTGEKQVSSSAGHKLMENHPFSEKRFLQANKNLSEFKEILETGDMKGFIEIVETEALSLHAMMMTGKPAFILMKPNTLEIIQKIWEFRKETGSNLCFTLDAGANVHLLYPGKEQKTISEFIENELVEFCQNGKYIQDFVQ